MTLINKVQAEIVILQKNKFMVKKTDNDDR